MPWAFAVLVHVVTLRRDARPDRWGEALRCQLRLEVALEAEGVLSLDELLDHVGRLVSLVQSDFFHHRLEFMSDTGSCPVSGHLP